MVDLYEAVGWNPEELSGHISRGKMPVHRKNITVQHIYPSCFTLCSLPQLVLPRGTDWLVTESIRSSHNVNIESESAVRCSDLGSIQY